MAKKANLLVKIASNHNRPYVTPEDVGEAMENHPADEVRLALLEVMAGNAGSGGCEDARCCAFVACKTPRPRRPAKRKQDQA